MLICKTRVAQLQGRAARKKIYTRIASKFMTVLLSIDYIAFCHMLITLSQSLFIDFTSMKISLMLIVTKEKLIGVISIIISVVYDTILA